MPDSADAPTKSRRGRRLGPGDARQDVLEAARRRFAADGFAATTVRGIAGDAGVDPALVMRFFGSKDDLFAAVMSVPSSALAKMADSFDGPADGLGQRVARAFLGVWEGDPHESEPLLAMLRSAVSNEQAAAQLREFIQSRLLDALVPRMPSSQDAALRAGLAASMLVGVVVGRRVVGVPVLVAEDRESVVAVVAPALQAVLVVDAT